MNMGKKLHLIWILAFSGWHLCAQEKSLPLELGWTTDSHSVTEIKTGFQEYTNAEPPKIGIYLHQVVHAEGDLSDTNQTYTFDLDNDATWNPHGSGVVDNFFENIDGHLSSLTTGSIDHGDTNGNWSHTELINTNGETTGNNGAFTWGNTAYPSLTYTNTFDDGVITYAEPPGGIGSWIDYYGYTANGTPYRGIPRVCCGEFMAGRSAPPEFGGCAGGAVLVSQSKTSETYNNSYTTSSQSHTVTYNLDSEYTKNMLKDKVLTELSQDTNADGGDGAEIYLTPDETTLTLGSATYSIATDGLGDNQLYILYEQLTATTNDVVYKHYSRRCAIVGLNGSFVDVLNIKVSSDLAFVVNGKTVLSQVGTTDTKLALTKVQLWRIGDFDPDDGDPFCSLCQHCDFQEDPGMPVWHVSEPDISLHILDTPVTYNTSLGTPMSFSVQYDHNDPRMAGTVVPTNNWNNSWSSYVHVFGDVNTNGDVDYGKWTGYLYHTGGGLSVYSSSNNIDLKSGVQLRPLNNVSPVGNGTNYGANGFRLISNDGSEDIYGLVTPVYSTCDSDGLNAVDRLAADGKLPRGLSAVPYFNRLNALADGWSYNLAFAEEMSSSTTNSGTTMGGTGGLTYGGGQSGNQGTGKGWKPRPISSFPNYTNEADALLTEHIDRYGNTTHYYYFTNGTSSSGQPFYLLRYVVDCDNKTNVVSYNSLNQITNVTTPYGQFAGFSYSGGKLVGITDAQGMSSSLSYDVETGLIETMTTPYGTTSFAIWDAGSVMQDGFEYGAAQGTNLISRAILVTRPGGSHDLYAYRYDSSDVGIPAEYYPSPAGATPIGTIDDGSTSGSDSDAAFYLRNSFHWTPKQYEQLSSITNLDQLNSHDYFLATMTHWLLGRYAGSGAGRVRSAIVQGSPDGTNAGAVTWFDYGNKVTPYQLGRAPLTRMLNAQVLPDNSTRYTDTMLTNALPASETTTYSLSDGSVGTRTYTADYLSVIISQNFTSGTNTISSSSWMFPELFKITGPQGESQIYLSGSYLTNAIIETNSGVVSAMQIPERMALSAVNAVSNAFTTYYNLRGQVTESLVNGLTTTNLYDQNGFPAQTIAVEIQRTNSYSFANGRLATATSPLGLLTRYSWDKLGRLTGINYPDNTSISNIYTRLDLTDQKDRLGNWQHSTYNSERHRLTFTDRNGHTTTNSYCSCGALESVTDPLSGTTIYDRNLNGLITDVTDVNSGRSYNLTRNTLGQITEVQDSADDPYNSFYYLYNNQGLLTNVMHGYSGTPLYQALYDLYDQPTVLVNANGIGVNSTYDRIGRVLTRSFPNGGTEQFEYSPAWLSRHYDLNHQLTTYGHDLAGRITSVTNANLEVTRYGYDAANDLLTLTDGRSKITSWAYDQYSRTISKTDANNVVVWTNGYNANGWLLNSWTPAKGLATYSQDANGNITNCTMVHSTVSRTFDALNRPTRIDFGNIRLTLAYTGFGAFKGGLSSETAQPISSGLDPSDATRGVSYGYQNELLVSETRADQTVHYARDVLGRLLWVTNSTGTFAYGYNGDGNLVQSVNYPTTYYYGTSSSKSYDEMGQVTNINELINGVQSAIAYDYDLNGNRLHVYRAKNWNNGYNDMDSSVSYGYDSIGQLTSAVGHETDGTPRRNEQFGYSYDSAGNLVGRTNGVLVQSFASDPANELTNVTRNTSLTFDGNGSTNLTSVTVNGQSTAIYSDQTFATSTGLSLANGTNSFTVIATDTSANELTNVFMANLPLAQRLSYDANGNLTSDGTRGFDYDDLNQLVRVTVTNAWKTEYDYDGLMRHHVRREYLWRNGGWALVNSCYYVYAGHNVVREVNTAQPTISYTYGLALLERDSNSSNQPSAFYETDGNGNVTLMFDVNQQIQAQYLYDPYGNLLAKSGPLADVNRYRFSSKEIDLRTGLYYYGYRYYEPNLQRWLNRDPIEERGGINLYSYVKNNPVNKIDPLGLTLIDGLNEATGNTEYIGSDDGSEAGYWRNLATHDEPEDYVAYDGYAEDQRRALYDVTHPNEGFGFIGGEAGAGPVKFECMGFAGMSKGKPLFGGLGAFGNGVMYGKEWSNQGGVENVLLLDPGAGYGAYSSKGSSGGFAYGFIGFPGFELFLGVGGGYAGH